ncbi:MAG TPA: hypothetical protein VJ927_11790 [Actinomycetota bacterium]|nr:hypothetical protein [Actinomycetota bacterium]
MRRPVAAILAVLVLAVLEAPASAEVPPRADLTSEGAFQEGSLKDYCWNELPIIQTCLDSDFYVFPADPLKAQDSASILFEKPTPPDSVTIRYWTRISRDDPAGPMHFDRPRGKARVIDAKIEPLLSAEGARWQATFVPPEPGKTMYLAVRAEWTIDVLCPGCRQWATWAFSIR